jgi:hypothetical protein
MLPEIRDVVKKIIVGRLREHIVTSPAARGQYRMKAECCGRGARREETEKTPPVAGRGLDIMKQQSVRTEAILTYD